MHLIDPRTLMSQLVSKFQSLITTKIKLPHLFARIANRNLSYPLTLNVVKFRVTTTLSATFHLFIDLCVAKAGLPEVLPA